VVFVFACAIAGFLRVSISALYGQKFCGPERSSQVGLFHFIIEQAQFNKLNSKNRCGKNGSKIETVLHGRTTESVVGGTAQCPQLVPVSFQFHSLTAAAESAAFEGRAVILTARDVAIHPAPGDTILLRASTEGVGVYTCTR
jgi:hypothetical protein